MNHSPSPQNREEEALARHRDELRKRFPLPSPTPRKPRKALATVLLLAMLVAGGAWFDPAYRSEAYSTVIGERQVVTLADGSRITLDSNTQVKVAWHVRTRRVQLESGQALFNVSKTLVRPFEVSAGAAQVKVLGTLFSVNKLTDAVRVTLIRGVVDVNSLAQPGRTVQLIAGQQVDVRQNQVQQPIKVDGEAVIAWKDSRLIFERTPLAEALQQIQRYRTAPILLADPDLGSLPISGVFDNRNVEALLQLLPSILPLSLNTDADGTTHIRRRAGEK